MNIGTCKAACHMLAATCFSNFSGNDASETCKMDPLPRQILATPSSTFTIEGFRPRSLKIIQTVEEL